MGNGNSLVIQRGAGGTQQLHIGYAFTLNGKVNEAKPKFVGAVPPWNEDIASPGEQSWVFSDDQDQAFDNVQIVIWKGDFAVCQVDFALSKDGVFSEIRSDCSDRNNGNVLHTYADGTLTIQFPPDVNLDV